jgi:hypothetical protein
VNGSVKVTVATKEELLDSSFSVRHIYRIKRLSRIVLPRRKEHMLKIDLNENTNLFLSDNIYVIAVPFLLYPFGRYSNGL